MRLPSAGSCLCCLGLSLAVTLSACGGSSSDGGAAGAGAGSSNPGQAGASAGEANTSGSSGAAQAGGTHSAGSSAGGATAQGGATAHGGATAQGGATAHGGATAQGGAPGTDHGTPPAQWTNVTGSFAGMQSECGNMGGVYADPFLDLLVIGVARQGLWSSTDGAATYQKIGTTGDMVLNRLSTVVWDPSSSKVFWVSGIYGFENPFTDGVFKTTDTGASFSGYKALSKIQSHNDSVSVDFTDPDRKTMLAGGHEQTGILFRSSDAGASWTDIGPSLPAGLGFCTATLVLDAHTMLVGCVASYSNKAGAIVRSSNGGDAWTVVASVGALGQPLWATDGSIYWTGESGGIYKSSDQGKNFALVEKGSTAGGLSPIEVPGGRIVSVVQRVLQVSADAGATWTPLGPAMPWDPRVIAYSTFRHAFYVTQFDCNNSVPADAIERFGYDFESQ